MTQWAEIRHLFFEEKLAKRAIARRIGVDRKTVQRAINSEEFGRKRAGPATPEQSAASAAAPGEGAVRQSPFKLEPQRATIEQWLALDATLPASVIRRKLAEEHGVVAAERTVRRFVATLRKQRRTAEAFVHRTHAPGRTLEADFFHQHVEVGGQRRQLFVFVATLPSSNAHFAKAYFSERLECLQDGLVEALRFFGGLPQRLVFDNATSAVRAILLGRERKEQQAFAAFRGELGLAVDYCAPAKGNEKGSVEGANRYVRNHVFRPVLTAASLDEVNAKLRAFCERDRAQRKHPDGGTVAEAFAAEQATLRPLPARLPATCRVEARCVNKYGHVEVQRVTYSVPVAHAGATVLAKLFHDRIEVVCDDAVVASHARVYGRPRAKVLDGFHALPLLEQKARAVDESSALKSLALPAAFGELRAALKELVRVPEREWVQVLRLAESYGLARVEEAVRLALLRGSPRRATVEQLLRHGTELPPTAALPAERLRPELAAMHVPAPDLAAYDGLVRRLPATKRDDESHASDGDDDDDEQGGPHEREHDESHDHEHDERKEREKERENERRHSHVRRRLRRRHRHRFARGGPPLNRPRAAVARSMPATPRDVAPATEVAR